MLLMKRIISIFTFLVIMFIILNCNTKPAPNENLHTVIPPDKNKIWKKIPIDFNNIAVENKQIAMPKPHQNIENILSDFVTNIDKEEDVKIAEFLKQKRILQNGNYSTISRKISGTDHINIFLTHEELSEEIKFLFDLLRNSYAAYQYFGGDDVFIPIRNKMLQRLNSMDNPLQVSSYLNDILSPLLWGLIGGVITDNHFQIHDITFSAIPHMLYMNNEFILRKEGNNFFVEIDGNLYKISEVIHNNLPILGILPTLSSSGDLSWVFGLVTEIVCLDTVELTVFLNNVGTNDSYTNIVKLSRIDSPYQLTYPEFATYEKEGILIIENRYFSESLLNNLFYQSSDTLRDRPLIILDLRGHYGGKDYIAIKWIQNYSGQKPIQNLLFFNSPMLTLTAIELSTPLGLPLASQVPSLNINKDIHTNYSKNKGNILIVLNKLKKIPNAVDILDNGIINIKGPIPKNIAKEFRKSGYGFLIEDIPIVGEIQHQLQMPIPNENLLIVLMDKNTSSAGEMFIGYLRQLENVIFIGTNTKGTLLTGGIVKTTLPYSNLDLWFSTILNIRPDLSPFEGIGFMPDLYVPPGESLERVLKFIERYGLAK